MCGRYSLAITDSGQLAARFQFSESLVTRARFNVAPADLVPAVTTNREGNRRGEMLSWGLVPGWAKDPSVGNRMINARAETLPQRPAFRQPLERYRCLIPADGFYEWQKLGARQKQPFHITRRDNALFAFAGLWSVWHRGAPDELRSCTIITTAANSAIAPLHDRMPVILEPEQEHLWLDGNTPSELVRELLHGLPAEEVSMRPVSRVVNDARFDGPECLEPAQPEADARQETLFG